MSQSGPVLMLVVAALAAVYFVLEELSDDAREQHRRKHEAMLQRTYREAIRRRQDEQTAE